MVMEKVEFIGRFAHHAWATYQMGAGLPYNITPTSEQLESQMDGTELWLEDPEMTSEQNHINWMVYREKEGWTYGPQKCSVCKTHPDLVPWDELPHVEKLKDEMDIMARNFALTLWNNLHAKPSQVD